MSSESFQKVVESIVAIKSAKDHTLRQRAIDNIINQYPTIFDRYFKPKTNFNNDELVILGGKNMEGLCKEVFPITFQEIIEYL